MLTLLLRGCRGLPGYWFRPLWCTLYLLMALSATLVYNQPQPLAGEVHKRVPLLLFTLQVTLVFVFVYILMWIHTYQIGV